MEKVWIIVNPSSGSEEALDFVGQLLKSYVNEFDEVVIRQTKGAGDATEFAQEAAAAQADMLFIMGGDGTVNEGINGLMQVEKSERPLLAILPLGTTNNLARILNYPMNVEQVIENFETAEKINIDVATVNGEYFVSTLSGGSVPESVQETDDDMKATFGSIAYFVEGLRALNNEKIVDYRLTFDGEEQTEALSMFIVGNSDMIFGLPDFFSDAKVNDGKLHFMGLKETTSVEKSSLIPELLMDDEENSEHLFVTSFKKATVEVDEPEEHAITVDGETGPTYPLEIEVFPEEITMLYFTEEA